MFGANDMGTIALEASNDTGLSWTTIRSESGNKGNSWFNVNLDISQYVGGSVQLRFNRITGGTWQADIAIDNIALKTSLAARQETTETKDQDVATVIDISSANTLTIFPNPVRGSVLNIKLDNGNVSSYRIINLYGQSVLKGTAGNQIKVEKLQSGVYFIEVSDGNNTLTKKFVKQ
jgi:hypothetical protein